MLPNVSSLWEYFDLQGPWRKVLTDLKKSLYTLQADPEKSRDFMLKNPGILIDWKSRDPVRAWSLQILRTYCDHCFQNSFAKWANLRILRNSLFLLCAKRAMSEQIYTYCVLVFVLLLCKVRMHWSIFKIIHISRKYVCHFTQSVQLLVKLTSLLSRFTIFCVDF